MLRKWMTGIVAGVLALGAAAAAEKSVEVVHWWTSGGEAAALNVLREGMLKRGYSWKDSPIKGGGGGQARVVLRARVAAGNPPDAMQMLGFTIVDYAKEGLLGDLSSVAAKEGWDEVVPAPLRRFSKDSRGHWVAAPMNIHRTNWIWANKAIFDELGISPPRTFDELMAISEKIKKAGYIPLAHGGQPWQEATIFDSAVMSAGGPDFYRKAMIDLDPKALGSATMEKAFDQLKKLRTLVDPNFSGRDWDLATAMVVNKKAAMQIMGDWAKGEFLKAGKQPNVDFLCFQYPGTEGDFIFNSDQFAMSNARRTWSFAKSAVLVEPQGQQDREKQVVGQLELASAIMDPSFQEAFNLIKGSIPARTDVSDGKFDACGKKSMADLKVAIKNDAMVGSFAHGHAMPEPVKEAVYAVVSKSFNSDGSSADAVKQLVRAVRAAE
jgi:glucose/mannose transport system substrate-binding protein